MISGVRGLLRFAAYVHAFAGRLLFGVAVLVVIGTFAFTVYQVDGLSMYPTFTDRQILGVNLTAYLGGRTPQEGDIVIVQYTGSRTVRFVKRVTATPGAEVEYNDEIITLGSNQYFVEGDNARHSTDSRTYGPITGEQILGHVVIAIPSWSDSVWRLQGWWDGVTTGS